MGKLRLATLGNHFLASSPIYFQIFSPKTLTALHWLLWNAGSNHERGLVNLRHKSHHSGRKREEKCHCKLFKTLVAGVGIEPTA